VVMPNVTPVEARRKYALYPGKRCLEEDAQQCIGCVIARITAIGRTVASGPGHVLRESLGPPRPGNPNAE
jgi:biotin synthase